MPRPKKISPQVPGTPTTANGETDADALAAGAADLDDGDDHARRERAAGTLTMTQGQLNAAIASAVAQALAAHGKAVTPLDAEASLPDQSEIDVDKITRPTLSKQGYVMPRNYGEPASPYIKRA